MAKYKPGKSGVASRKIKKLKEDIKSESDKDRIKKLEEQLAILMAGKKRNDTGKKNFPMYSVPRDYDGGMNEETIAELRAGASQRDLEQGISRIKGKKNYQPLPKDKKGGGKVHGAKKKKGMMGGGKIYASSNKRYANGGKIYPTKGNM